MIDDNRARLDAEWLATNALRELIDLATEGDSSKATYDQALALGARILPNLLGEDSLIKRGRESDVAAEFRQKAQAKGLLDGKEVSALVLLKDEIAEYERLVQTARKHQKTSDLKRRLTRMQQALKELDPSRHSENELIFRDARHVTRKLPEIASGQGYSDFQLSSTSVLRVRVFHPDRQEHISGADIFYERHDCDARTANVVAVQYKIWDEKVLHLNEPRMRQQLARMKTFVCDHGLCRPSAQDHTFRFPYCSAFLRPTDKLQTPDQRLASTGEHLPICQIPNVKSEGTKGAEVLSYNRIREMSLSHDEFQGLFTTGKVGSRTLTYSELEQLYRRLDLAEPERLLIHAQDFDQPSEYHEAT